MIQTLGIVILEEQDEEEKAEEVNLKTQRCGTTLPRNSTRREQQLRTRGATAGQP